MRVIPNETLRLIKVFVLEKLLGLGEGRVG
jgi:hypothetical protein